MVRNYLILFFVLYGMVMCNPRVSAETFISTNAATYHFNREATRSMSFNETNEGIGIDTTYDGRRYLFGAYKNSMYKASWYALTTKNILHSLHYSLDVVGGGVTGYLGDVTPAIGLLITAQFGRIGANIIITPDVPNANVYWFAALQIKLKFGE